jgi:molybdopterin-guanine dinucleotide biosynthesis protein A
LKPAAVLLAGGIARRMGGGDKSLRLLAGKPILAHVIARIQPQADALVLNANGDPTRFPQWMLPVVADAIPGNPGPLAGIHAGMVWARARYPEIASVPTDLPFLPDDLIERLRAARLADGADIAVAASEGHSHPVVALWPTRLADDLHRAMSGEGLRRVREFAGRYRVVFVDFPVAGIDPFYNINNPDDLANAPIGASGGDMNFP